MQVGRLRLREFKQPAHHHRAKRTPRFQPRQAGSRAHDLKPGLTFKLVNKEEGIRTDTSLRDRAGFWGPLLAKMNFSAAGLLGCQGRREGPTKDQAAAITPGM